MDMPPSGTDSRGPPPEPSWVQALLRPEAYAAPTSAVALAQTHISLVFLTDRRVYKCKKPVRFPFLDFSTLDQRRHFCLEEVRLNRRLAPQIYHGVLPITQAQDGAVRVGGDGVILDWCVEMERLPAERMLDHLIERGQAGAGDMERLLDVLLPFYAAADRGPQIAQHGTAPAMEAVARENLATLASGDHGLTWPMFQRVRSSQLQFLRCATALFAQRLRDGRVCEGHGDLRPEHICLLDPPVVFDCVEFAQAIRSADVLSELAFLAMECDFLQAPDLGDALLEAYRRRTGDEAPEELSAFYRSHRACVRAKVEMLRAGQQVGGAAAEHLRRSQRYLQLASYYAIDFYRPTLFVMVGVAGSGKSTVAAALADALGLERIRSDAVRQELAGQRDPQASPGEGIYSPAMTERTYAIIFDQAETLLGEAVSVVLDGTFRSADHRAQAALLGQRYGAHVYLLHCVCPPETARARIAARMATGQDISDARPELLDRQLQELQLAPAENAIPLDTTQPVSGLIDEVVRQLASREEFGRRSAQ